MIVELGDARYIETTHLPLCHQFLTLIDFLILAEFYNVYNNIIFYMIYIF